MNGHCALHGDRQTIIYLDINLKKIPPITVNGDLAGSMPADTHLFEVSSLKLIVKFKVTFDRCGDGLSHRWF